MKNRAPAVPDRLKKPHRIPDASERILNYVDQAPPSGCLERFLTLPLWIFNHDFAPFFDACLERFEFVFRRLEFFCPFLRDKSTSFKLNQDIFGKVDKRENFLPIRFQTIAEQIVATALPTESRSQWSRFCRLCVKRYHYEFLRESLDLNNAFAAFDPDADALYPASQNANDLLERRDRFFDGIDRLLRAGNFVQLPPEETDKILRFRRSGSLPIVARLNCFEEARVFIRGALPLKRFYSRLHGGFRRVTVETQLLSRVCILARVKVKDSLGVEKDEIFFKIFKNVLLEDLKMAIPSVQFSFPYLKALFSALIVSSTVAGVFFSGTLFLQWTASLLDQASSFWEELSTRFADGTSKASGALDALSRQVATSLQDFAPSPADAASSEAARDVALARFVGALSFVFTLPALIARQIAGFVHRRTRYQKRHSTALYFQTLASNRAAISLLVTLAEEQEVKEIVLGYFAASQFWGWATEEEIDRLAETWIRDNFAVDFDFESDDALRKLLEKRLIERRERELGLYEYRAVPLDEAIRRLKDDWLALEEAEDAQAAALKSFDSLDSVEPLVS